MYWKDICSVRRVGGVATYLSLVFQLEFIHAFKCIFRDGPRAAQTTTALLPSDCSAVACSPRPDEPWVEFYLSVLTSTQKGFQALVKICDFHGSLC